MNYALYANNNLGQPNGQVDVGGEQNVVGTAGWPSTRGRTSLPRTTARR